MCVQALDQADEEWSVHNIFYKNGYLIASYYAFGLQIIDVSDPSNMQIAGYYDTFTDYPADLFDGAWGAFPYFDSDRIIVSDRSSGLYVLDFLAQDWADPFIMGDLNNDNTVNIQDILIVIGHIIDYNDLSVDQIDAADTNNDQIINILDIIAIMNIILYE